MSIKHDIKESTDIKVWALHHLTVIFLALAPWAHSIVFVWPVEHTLQLYSMSSMWLWMPGLKY